MMGGGANHPFAAAGCGGGSVGLDAAAVALQTDHRGSGPDLPRGLGRLYLQAGLKPTCAVLSVR